MVLSMTGFGRSEGIFEGKKIVAEIKSLNSKTFDLSIRIPARYKEKEFEIRKLLNDKILRGKVDCYLNCEFLEGAGAATINADIVSAYISQLKTVAKDGPEYEYLKMALRFPDATSVQPNELNQAEYDVLLKIISEAMEKFEDFRKTEGEILKEELSRNIGNISQNLQKVIPFEEVRMDAVKERYKKTLSEFKEIDETRFYQEMAYYTEKLDIQEEKVRLSQHLKYYEEVMQNENLNGKKLGFIAQEIGREINTLGSKANHSDIQKLVVEMKDDLEKIKEQTLNVL